MTEGDDLTPNGTFDNVLGTSNHLRQAQLDDKQSNLQNIRQAQHRRQAINNRQAVPISDNPGGQRHSKIIEIMSGLKRFQLTPSSNKRPADEFPSHPKQLGEVAKFNAPGIFFVRANVADLQFSLYKACPLKVNGAICRKKLDDEMCCRGCAHRANNPLQCLFLRVELQDCDEPEICQKATIFSSVAEGYLTMRVEHFANMVEKSPKELEALLQSKLGQTVTVKLNLKEKGGEFSSMDWIIVAILEEKENEADKEDGEIIEIDNTGKKRAKKN
ncbi:hypothetical protein niasHT_027929 [Heterodera trifolii]|uniref:Replication factor A C-terminal domain-containing protein n=1 Tax=Heterodera trifolii TaxID=157864 RepID=A0ABD2JX45_9BILA